MTNVFIEPTPTQRLLVSYSELDSFRQCPFKHQLGYKERWTKPTTSPALSRGTSWHEIMESQYKTLKVIQEADPSEKAEDALWDLHTQEVTRILADAQEPDLLEWMYEGYLEAYGIGEETWGWKILAVEQTYEVPLPHPQGKRSRIYIKLKIDVVVRDPMGRIWIVDHKTGKDLPKDKQLRIDDQFSLYVWALRFLGKDVFGAVHDAVRTHKNVSKHQPLDERFQRTRMHRTDEELAIVAADAYATADTAWRHYRWDRNVTAPRAPDSDRCGWRCDFTEPCMHSRATAQDHTVTMHDFGFVQNYRRH